MNMFLSKKMYSLLFMVMSLISYAQSVPPPPENPESGDIGVTAKSPIDSHIGILLFIGLMIITFYAIRYYRSLSVK